MTKKEISIAATAEHHLVHEKVQKFENIPALPGLPIIGNLHQFLKKENANDLSKFAADLKMKYGDMVR